MLGYPRRHAPQRRAAPTVTLFDPSADSACTGWWRADVGVNVSNASRNLASGITSRLADNKPFVNAGSPPWLIVPQASNGFPGLLPASEGWIANGIAVAADRALTATWVTRHIQYKINHNTYMCGISGMGHFGMWDSWVRVYHPYAGWINWIDNSWYPFNAQNISVLTMRVKPVDEAGANLLGQYRFNFNTSQLGPFNEGGAWGDRVMSPTTTISFQGSGQGPYLFHEQIFFRRHLADAEVVAMHNLLLQQYGQSI